MNRPGVCLALLLSVLVVIYPRVSSFTKRESPLIIELLRKDRVDGSYVHPNLGYGIVFNATEDGLTLSTLSGARLLSTEKWVGPVHLLTLGKREFIQHSDSEGGDESATTVRDYAIPKHHRSYKGTQDHETLTNLVDKLKKLNPKTHSRVMEKSVKKLLSKREINLLLDVAVAMGSQGITGQDYPSILPLFMTASRLAPHASSAGSVQSDSFVKPNDVGKSIYLPHEHERLKRDGCLDECPPCKDQECLGLCGPGCTCWEWSCGNCCYNVGCYYHDLCCRSQPSSLACLMPLGFDCNSKYVCKSPK